VGFNITLIGQMITFILFVAITMKYVWPHIIQALQERQDTIAEGLAAAERGNHELELAQHKSTSMLREAKIKAAEIIDQANKRAAQIIEQAKDDGRVEGERMLEMARSDIAQEQEAAREQLRQEVAGIAVAGAERILGQQIDQAANNSMIEQLITEVSSD
tara:strand:+ start:88859 stop:89338 length:480 start_codon:yes stop_codon:yes gene_type:complete